MINDSNRGRYAPEYELLRGVTSLCALAGCSLPPRYQAPPLPVPAAYPIDSRMQPNATAEGRIAAFSRRTPQPAAGREEELSH